MLRIICAVLLLLSGPALAASHGNPNLSPYAKAVLNTPDVVPSAFVNVFKSCGFTFGTATDFGKLDQNHYLTSTPVSSSLFSCGNAGGLFPGQYRLSWPGTRTFKIFFLAGYACTNVVHATVTNCGGGPPGNTFSIASDGSGQAGSVDFTFAPTTTQISAAWATDGTYGGSGELALYRVSDAALYAAGQYWTNELVQQVKGSQAKICREMGLSQNGGTFNGEVKWAYRRTVQDFSWVMQIYPPGIMSGSPSYAITRTGTDVYTSAAATDTPGTITADEMFIGIIDVTNTTTTPTLNIGGRGAKTIVNAYGFATDIGGLVAGNYYTFYYDAVLDKYVASSPSWNGGITAGAPIEAQVQLANLVGCDLWTVVPAMANDDYVTNWATIIANNLSSSLKFYAEYSNEIWNGSFPQTAWASARGRVFGFTAPSNQDVFGYYGIRVKQVLGSLIPAVWPGGATSSRYMPVMAYQAAGDNSNWTNRFEGAQLCPVAQGGSCAGNAAYNSFTGSASWNSAPNRPVDATKILAMAPYTQGQNLCVTPDNTCTPDSLNAPFYQSLVNAWESGQAQTAYNLIDADMRTGLLATQTVTCSGTTFTTPLAHGFSTGSTLTNTVAFTVAGGTSYSGIPTYTGTNQSAVYKIASVPTGTTFTVQAYVGGFPSGGAVNCGSPGSGTLSVGISRKQNLLNLTTTWYSFAEANAERYNGGVGGSRPAGMGNLMLGNYEGNLEIVGPSSAQCISLAIVGSNCSTSISNAIAGYYQTSLAQQLQLDYFKMFMGTYSGAPNFGLMTYAQAPSQLVLNGGGAWAFNLNYLPNINMRQSFFGFQQFNTNP